MFMLKTDVPIEKYDIYIFDFDGTIIDSKELMKKISRKLCETI